jgi:hypothetical protein
VDRRWYSHTPNYYFPKIDRFPDLKTTTMAFLVSSVSLLFVISCLILSLYRNGNRSREQEELQNQLQTISQLLGRQCTSNFLRQLRLIQWNLFEDGSNNNNRLDENIEPPPIYEQPPAYDEIIKIGMDNEIRRSKREGHSGRKSRLRRPRLKLIVNLKKLVKAENVIIAEDRIRQSVTKVHCWK